MWSVKLSGSSFQKMKELIEGSVEWLKVKMGPCDHRLNIRKELTKSDASISKCEAMFGKRKCNNGFKYDNCVELIFWLLEWKNYMLLFIKSQILLTTQLG
jgi:hypothetical protein